MTHKLYFAVFHFHDLARADLDGFVGRWNLTCGCLKRTAMRTPPRQLENDRITGDLDRVERRPRIRERRRPSFPGRDDLIFRFVATSS
jgi:hypothetical protein